MLDATDYKNLLGFTQDIFCRGADAGMPSSWMYDLTFAYVAVALVEQSGDPDEVRKLNDTDFFVFGDVKSSISQLETQRKADFTRDVVVPLWEAYKVSPQVKKKYSDADSLFRFIVGQWYPEYKEDISDGDQTDGVKPMHLS